MTYWFQFMGSTTATQFFVNEGIIILIGFITISIIGCMSIERFEAVK